MFMKEIPTHLAHCELFCVECLVLMKCASEGICLFRYWDLIRIYIIVKLTARAKKAELLSESSLFYF